MDYKQQFAGHTRSAQGALTVDNVTRAKWDRAAPTFDIMAGRGAEQRWRPFKQALFNNMDGKILFLALGTGLDIETFPPQKNITAIDISPKMLEVARPRVAAYDGEIDVKVADVHELNFPTGKVITTTLAQAQVIIRRLDTDQFELVIRRSFADYIWSWLRDAAMEFGVNG